MSDAPKKTPAKKTPAPRKSSAKTEAVGAKIDDKKAKKAMTDAEFEQRVTKVLVDFFKADAELQEDLRRPSRWARFFGIK